MNIIADTREIVQHNFSDIHATSKIFFLDFLLLIILIHFIVDSFPGKCYYSIGLNHLFYIVRIFNVLVSLLRRFAAYILYQKLQNAFRFCPYAFYIMQNIRYNVYSKTIYYFKGGNL